MEGTRARMGSVVARLADLQRSRPLHRRMIHTVEGPRTEGILRVIVLGIVTLAVLEAPPSLLVVGVTGAFRPRRILVGHYARSFPRGG